jgi:N-acetylneuraminic acid mutarotase
MQAILKALRINRLRTPAAILFVLVLPSLIILTCHAPAETADWSVTGPLVTGRGYHTATLLTNGKVLVAGGDPSIGGPVGGGGVSNLDSAELYNPATGTWSATGSLAITPRALHTATLLTNGKVLVAGGDSGATTGGELNSAELYDPATGYWDATGSLAAVRKQHTATLLADGRVLVAAGFYAVYDAYGQRTPTYRNTAELYDPATGTWSATGSLAAARADYTATLLPNGKVLVAGGYYEAIVGGYWHRTNLNTAELYDPSTGTWGATGSLAAARAEHTATLLPNGKVLVAGGYNNSIALQSAQLYDPDTGTWHTTGSLAAARYNHTATLLPNGKVLVAGGCTSSSNFLDSAEIYDPAAGTWSSAGTMSSKRNGHTGTLLSNGKVLVTGGFSSGSGGGLKSAELYRKSAAMVPIEFLLLGN